MQITLIVTIFVLRISSNSSISSSSTSSSIAFLLSLSLLLLTIAAISKIISFKITLQWLKMKKSRYNSISNRNNNSYLISFYRTEILIHFIRLTTIWQTMHRFCIIIIIIIPNYLSSFHFSSSSYSSRDLTKSRLLNALETGYA